MESVKDIIKNVLDDYFETDEQDKVIYLDNDDTDLVASAVEQSLRKKGIIQ